MEASDPDSPVPAALEAAVRAFAAARSARILLDGAGRLGADAVTRASVITGARRASRKAQAGVEDAARRMAEARDRWGALMRGLAGDLATDPTELVSQVERWALRLAILDAEVLLREAAGAASLLTDSAELRAELQSVLAQVAGLARHLPSPHPDQAGAGGGSESG